MAQVTYFLGAGASAECVPVVSGMKDDFNKTFTLLAKQFGIDAEKGGNAAVNAIKANANLSKTQKVLRGLKNACAAHYSIDTYAKKLYLTDRTKFHQLKLDLSFYLTLVQILNPIDKRYDNFWASMLSDTESLPSKVKIISWNYDFQVEKSYQNLTNIPDLNKASSCLRYCCPQSRHPSSLVTDEFCFIKLNGSAKLNSENKGSLFLTDHKGDKKTLVENVIKTYLAIDPEASVAELQFAWEDSTQLFKHIQKALCTIEVLVIIGYSFPFFNRPIDSMLLGSMSKLKTIYIQDIQPGVIKESLEEIIDFNAFSVRDEDGNVRGKRKLEVICKDKVNQFVFPKELEIN